MSEKNAYIFYEPMRVLSELPRKDLEKPEGLVWRDDLIEEVHRLYTSNNPDEREGAFGVIMGMLELPSEVKEEEADDA